VSHTRVMPATWHVQVIYRPEGVPADYQPATAGDAPEGWE
jgi:hypothetical protein